MINKKKQKIKYQIFIRTNRISYRIITLKAIDNDSLIDYLIENHKIVKEFENIIRI